MIPQFIVDLFSRLARYGSDETDSPDTRIKKTMLVVSFTLVSAIFILVIGPLYILFQEPAAGSLYIIYAVYMIVNLAYFGQHRSYRRLFNLVAIPVLPVHLLDMIVLGNFINSGAIILWGMVFPVTAALIVFDLSQTVPWIIGFVINLILSAVLQPYLPQTTAMPPAIVQIILTVNLLLISAFLIGIPAYFIGQRNLAFRLLRDEQVKAENLLLNILPRDIAAILKDETRTIADHFEGVSIMFADVVNFTPMSATMTPVELVSLLNEIFSHFDLLVEKYQLEKIKTIGDCYMVAAGVPHPQVDHANRLVRMALEMQAFIASRSFHGKQIAFRVGINSGAVVAGVIGRKKFIYDLWGDAVNTASRMESHGARGTIQVTRSTYELIADDFDCEAQGTIDVKGKGPMEVWHVTGEKAAYARA